MIAPSSAYMTEHNRSTRTPIYQIRLTVPHPLDSTLVTGLKAYWKMEEAYGTRYDAIGLADLLDVNVLGDASGKIGQAAHFTGTNYCERLLPDTSPLRVANADWAIGIWVYLESKADTQTIISQYGPYITGLRGWALRYNQGSDRFDFLIRDASLVQKTVEATTFGSPTVNTWYFIAAWHNAATDTINISVNNGATNSAATAGIFADMTSNIPLRMGADSSGTNGVVQHFLRGRIDEASFWTTLSAFNTATLYNGGAGSAIAFTDPSQKNYCTSRPSAGTDIGSAYLKLADLNRRAEIELCRLPLSTLAFDLLDISGAVTTVMALGIANALCELRGSFYDIAWTEAVLLFTGIINEIAHDGGVYHCQAAAHWASAQDKILFAGAKTQLTVAQGLADAGVPGSYTVDVADNAAFQVPQRAVPWSDTTVDTLCILIDNEFEFPNGLTGTTQFSGTQRVGTYGFQIPPPIPNSESTTHALGAVVRELVALGGLTATNSDSGTNNIHPIDLLQYVLATANAKFGIGELAIQPNLPELAAARTAIGASMKMLFLDDQPVNAKKFLEEEIYLPCAMWPTENALGELGAKLYGAAPGVFDSTIGDSEILQFPEWLHNLEKRVNVVIYYYDHSPLLSGDQAFTSTFEYRDETLLAQHGREYPLVIYSKGIRSQFTQTVPSVLTWFGATEAFLLAACQRHIARFGDISPVISAKAILRKDLLELSDDLQVTLAQAVNVDTGVRTLTNAPFEVAATRVDFDACQVELELLGYPS